MAASSCETLAVSVTCSVSRLLSLKEIDGEERHATMFRGISSNSHVTEEEEAGVRRRMNTGIIEGVGGGKASVELWTYA